MQLVRNLTVSSASHSQQAMTPDEQAKRMRDWADVIAKLEARERRTQASPNPPLPVTYVDFARPKQPSSWTRAKLKAERKAARKPRRRCD